MNLFEITHGPFWDLVFGNWILYLVIVMLSAIHSWWPERKTLVHPKQVGLALMMRMPLATLPNPASGLEAYPIARVWKSLDGRLHIHSDYQNCLNLRNFEFSGWHVV